MLANRNRQRKRRHLRVRKKVQGTAQCPRMNVYRSNTNIFVQVIDDEAGRTLVSSSTLDPQVREAVSGCRKIEAAFEVGKVIAQKALEVGIKKVVFDRGGYQYHGRVKAVAEGARAGGLEF